MALRSYEQIKSETGYTKRMIERIMNFGLVKVTEKGKANENLFDDHEFQKIIDIKLLMKIGFELKDIKLMYLDGFNSEQIKSIKDCKRSIDARIEELEYQKTEIDILLKEKEKNRHS